MRIAVVGTGSVGSVLGSRWAGLGHDVTFGSRRPDSPTVAALVARAGTRAAAALPEAAVAAAHVVLLAVPGSTAADVAAGLGDLSGKVLVDCTNPILPGLSGLAWGRDDSGAERIQRVIPEARVVKAFNTTGAANMADPILDGRRLVMPVCGDDSDARDAVAELAAELGFEPLDSGPLHVARYLEPLAMLWITLATQRGMGPHFGFTLARSDGA